MSLAAAFLAVSLASLILQGVSLVRLMCRLPPSGAARLAGGGYVRTAACRVLAAAIYVTAAAFQVAGGGSLTSEALIIFTVVQALWQVNALLDVRIRNRLAPGGRHRMGSGPGKSVPMIGHVARAAPGIAALAVFIAAFILHQVLPMQEGHSPPVVVTFWLLGLVMLAGQLIVMALWPARRSE